MHPDNNQTGHEENFRLLKAAYDVLSDPHRRAEYDAARAKTQTQPEPLAAQVDFMDALDGELNRRLAVLAVLYYRRRTNPANPEVALSEIEGRMGFPRDYLDFTLWYLQKKGYVAKSDSARYTLSVEGVDFVEEQRASLPTLQKLLTSGSRSSAEDIERSQYREAPVTAPESAAASSAPRQPAKVQPFRASAPIVLPASISNADWQRMGKPERRAGKLDSRDRKVERRVRRPERREESQA